MQSITIRSMVRDDVGACMGLVRGAGWNQVPRDWERFIGYAPRGVFVAVSANRQIVGTVTTTAYDAMAWIGMMLVDPHFRRQGIATRLLKHAIAHLQSTGIGCIKLDATPAGEPVYERLGFIVEWSFQRWQRLSAAEAERGPNDRATGSAGISSRGRGVEQHNARANRFALSAELDRSAFGDSRQKWLELLASDSKALGGPAGFAMLRGGRVADYLGPVSAVGQTEASQMIGQLLGETSRSVLWDVPGPNAAATELATELGFAPIRQLTRMYLGALIEPRAIAHQYAMADPATG